MQPALPPQNTTGLDPSKWVRKRTNFKLYREACAPLEEARAAGFDPWSYENGKFVYRTNPVWEAAVLEFNVRFQAYEECKPFPKRLPLAAILTNGQAE